MQSFTLFQTNGRDKFLKKKKQQKNKNQTQIKNLNAVLRIQNNIRRFLQYKNMYESFQRKMQIQGEDKTRYQGYWFLTSYHVRKYQLEWKVINFWRSIKAQQNQFLVEYKTLLIKMIKLTIQFLPKILDKDFTQGLNVCEILLDILKRRIYEITQSEVQSLLKTFRVHINIQIIEKMKKQLIDILLENQDTRKLVSEIFLNQEQFLDYLFAENKSSFIQKNSPDKIKQLVYSCYPKILQNYQNLKKEYRIEPLSANKFNEICLLYTQTLKIAQKQNTKPQNTLILMAFLNDLTNKIKEFVVKEITKRFNIDPKLFQTELAYQQYLQEKQEYFIMKQILMGHYQQTKNFIAKSLQIVMNKYQNQFNNEITIKEQAMQYIFQLINLLGQNIEIVKMNKAITFLMDNTNQTMIYDVGKQKSFFSKPSISSEVILNLLLILANKSVIQTPDLHFVKFYQEKEEKDKLKKLIKQYLLKILKHTMFLPKLSLTQSKITKTTISLLQNLYNKIFRTDILPTQIFENSSFIMKFKNYQYKKSSQDQISMFLTQFPYVFPLQLRAFKFREILRNQRHTYHYGGVYFDDSDDQMEGNSNNVRIRRNYEFIDAFNKMRKTNLRKYFKVTFINQLGFEQKGIDAGGLKKQFLNRVLKDALNPNFGMFIENEQHELLPHPTKAELKEGVQTQYYEFIGKLIGLAIYQNITLGYKFAGLFLNAIVGKKNCFDDLRKIDPDLYRSLIYIKDMDEDAKQLGLTFIYKDQMRNKSILLKPNGHLVEVTNQNKRQYISLLTAYKVNKLLEHQTRFIRKGLTSMINKEWLFMFNYEQLNYLISGQGEIDVEDLRNHSKVMGFQGGSKTIQYFWQIVREFNEQQKSQLLMFVTACPRPSFLGFKQLSPPFTIVNIKDNTDMLPVSHTCSNVLELPDYNDRQILRKKLLTAIESNSGFQFG